MIEIKVPSPGESISQVQLASWLVEDGAYVFKDDEIAEIDSDKATLSIAAEESGVIKILVEEGDTMDVGSIMANIDTSAKAPERTKEKEEKPGKAKSDTVKEEVQKEAAKSPEQIDIKDVQVSITPLAKKLLAEKDINADDVKEGILNLRITKSDVQSALKSSNDIPDFESSAREKSREVESQKLSTLRKRLAQRLVTVKNETAMLTTFNEVNMGPIMALRSKYKNQFLEKFGVKLGFMSFFSKAVAEALMQFPQVNSMLDGDEMITPQFVDIGIAVSAPKGLVVPVIRNVESLSIAEIEIEIANMAVKARNNRISLDDMKGGTFTITNGGVFGSMLSTPIINPPQSAILGMHNIIERPIALNGKVVIQPMMYLAISYDHRIIDGRESVSFLVKLIELLENPIKLLTGGNDPEKLLLGI